MWLVGGCYNVVEACSLAEERTPAIAARSPITAGRWRVADLRGAPCADTQMAREEAEVAAGAERAADHGQGANTKGSILIAILLHTSFDVFVGPVGLLFPAPLVTDYGGALPMLIGLGVTALVLVAVTRGRLGYRNYRQVESPDPATAPT